MPGQVIIFTCIKRLGFHPLYITFSCDPVMIHQEVLTEGHSSTFKDLRISLGFEFQRKLNLWKKRPPVCKLLQLVKGTQKGREV